MHRVIRWSVTLVLLSVLALIASQVRAQAPGLVAEYGFNEGSGSIVGDSSGNANAGTITAATWVTAGKYGNALLFNGTSAKIRVNDASSLDLTGAMTVEAWVYPTASQSGWRAIVQKQTDSYFLHASYSGGALRPVAGGTFGTSDAYTSAPAAITVNVWTHLAMTYDGAQLRLYVNGNQVASLARTGAITPTASPLWIGGNSPYGEYFIGRIDEVRIYNRALAASEIASDMARAVGPADTTAPGATTNLTATPASSSQINVAWTAATDNVGVTGYDVERCQGVSCTAFAQIGTAAGTTYNNTGLAASTDYSYRVRARDAAGNPGAYSNTASAATPAAPDNPPTAPTGLSASASGTTQINLAWVAATDDHGISLYEIERCQGAGCASFAQVGTAGVTTYSDAGLTASTSYSYRVRARDSIGNPGPYGNVATAITPASPDTTPPTAPANLAATAAGSTQVNLSWTAATDDRAIALYELERCQGAGCASFAPIGTATVTTFNDAGRAASTSYSYRARAKDTANNYGPYGNVATATTPAAPPPASGLVAAYAFDEGAGGSVADASGNGNAGTIANATWTTAGKFGKALVFNGTSAKVTIPDVSALDLTTAMTLEAWVYPTVTPTNWSTILHKETDRYYLGAGSSDGTPAAGGTFTSGNTNVYGASSLTANAWTHVAATYDGTTLRLFLNGAQAASKAVAGPITASGSPVSIGGTAAYGEYFTGRIDEVRVYSRALSAAEIATDMTVAVGGSPAPNGPKLIVTAPLAASTVLGSTVNVTYTWTGDLTEVNHVHFQMDSDPMVMDLSFEGVYAFGGVRVGSHTLNGWLVRADHSKIAGSDAQPLSFAVAVDPADPAPPSVTMTAPSAGSTVSGVVTITANATDNVGVYGVEFKLDGAILGAEDRTAPYATNWNAAGSTNGLHSLTATGRDVAGNEATATAVTVTVSNAGPNDPSVVGQWAGPYNWPLVSVHTMLMPNGKVLLYDDHTTSAGVQVWDPVTDTLTNRPYNANNLFCSGHTLLPDGRVLVVGGHIGTYIGIPDATYFDPATERWSPAAAMAYGRWYPTATSLPNGKVLAVSGAINCPTCVDPNGSHAGIALIPEVYDPKTNTWSKLTSASLSLPLYPHMYVLPDGRVLAAATQEDPIVSRVLDLDAQTWTVVDPVVRDAGSSVMYRPGKILKSGTARNADYSPVPAVASAWAVDMNLPSPTWRAIAPMAFPRTQHNLTLLPDGNVLLVGGGTNSSVYDTASAVKAAELWSPLTETWRTLAPMQEPRLYHSTALLLPDARVMVSGGGRFGPDFPSAEIYSPPYLFKGPRPVITSVPPVIQYNGHFTVSTPDAARIAKVTLLRPGSPTHAFDANQRYVELAFVPAGGGLDVTGPTNANIVLPGHAMLFLVDTNGVPSVSAMVRFPAPWEEANLPTAPASLVASTTPGKVDLAWTAATDDNGIALYNVHRGPLPGVTPAPGNRIGLSATTSYRDTGFAAGVYYYAVTAQDLGGNVGPASNEVSVVAQADTTPPVVAVTSPLSATTVSAVVTVTADATDDIGVTGVQFLLDGTPLGAEDGSPPYAVDWNTGLAANGAHVLQALARDARGNLQASTGVAVTVSNTTIQGLAAAYGFDEGSGTSVGDSSANANDGAVGGTAWTTGHAGSALSYNGQNSYVTIPNSPSLDIAGKAITIEMWANITAGSVNDYVLVAKPWAASGLPYPYYQYGIEYDANGARTLDFYFGDTTGQLRGPFSMIPPTGVWTHLAYTYDGTTVKGYLDGVLKLSAPASTDIQARGIALLLGVDGAHQQGFGGKLDDLRIYTRALTQAEIQQDMQ